MAENIGVCGKNTRDFRAAWFYSKTGTDLFSLQLRGTSLSRAFKQEAGEESKPTSLSVTKERKLMSILGGRHGVRFILFSEQLFRFCSLSCKLVGCCD